MPEPTVPIPNEAGWSNGRLDEMCSVVSRGRAPTYVERSNVLAIGQRCVTDGAFDPSPARPHSEHAMNGVLEPAAGDVLLNSTGTGTIGRSCVFDAQGRFVVDGHITVLRLRAEAGVGRWLSEVLRTPWGQTYLETQCYSGSTNQVELSRMRLAATRLPVPPLAEQRRIADILDTVDEAIRKTEEIIAKLKQVKQGLLHDLLTRGINDNGELRDPDRDPEQFKDSPLGRIPNAWLVHPIGDLLAHVIDYRGRTPRKLGMDWGGTIPALSAMNVKPGKIDLARDTYYGSERLYSRWMTNGDCQRGDVLMTMEAPLGNVAQVPDEQRYILSQRVVLLRFDHATMANDYAAVQMRSTRFQQNLVRWSTGTTATGIQRAKLVRVPLMVPPLAEQKAVSKAVRSGDERIVAEETRLEKLSLLKRGLMEDLLTGRVRVPSE